MIEVVKRLSPADVARAQVYAPRGAAFSLFGTRAPEVVLDGPAGTGKSSALLTKLYLCARKYAKMRGLVVRKTRASLTDTGLVTFEEDVLPANSYLRRGPRRRYRHSYDFPNGSEIVIGGMDNETSVMSSQYDMVVALEATELTKTDWQNLTSRLRNFRMPYQQILGDCNPSHGRHWLKERADGGVIKMMSSRHEDNPLLWDARRGEWTERGRFYVFQILDNLSGVNKRRLRYGEWASAEGAIFGQVWNPDEHRIFPFPVPADWPRFWVVDFGYTNPFVWQCWALDDDGRLYRIAEIYRTGRLVEDHAADILKWQAASAEPLPVALICDHDAEDRATLERHLGILTTPARKQVRERLQLTESRLRVAGDGRPRLFYFRDAVIETDEALVAVKKPTCTEEEFDGYVWEQAKDGRNREAPVKRDDHGLDATGYVVSYVDVNYSKGVFV